MPMDVTRGFSRSVAQIDNETRKGTIYAKLEHANLNNLNCRNKCNEKAKQPNI